MVKEKSTRRVHVFKCPKCGREERFEGDLKNLKGVFCGDFGCTNDYCVEDRVELVNSDGEVIAEIV